ncbi:FadR/GntR family transcriptional regulator [Terrihalobacillus insolitus]|uniref:FadR/GntR family transcriptional regulator n=1 Tax=Terrihalobacillus insolitus TaxID=2950438 RepID=UPI00234276CF|nr:FadR/GntR family transcriptional regulator [Terrihalobacillus insolitus]MDC3414840.1 FadR family transcriptional regulator [Terrihalobacillus insolitus]
MSYKQIKPRKIYEEVADELLTMIKNGVLKPGDKLNSVQQLAEDFQVGRSAVREALSALRAMELVEMRQGEGTYVRQYDSKALSPGIMNTTILMNEKDIHDLLEVRKILEVGSVTSAVFHAEETDIQLIEGALEKMRQTNGDRELGEQADFDFHMSIAKASHNRILIDLMERVSDTTVKAMYETRRLWLFSEQTTLKRIHQEHKLIFEAIQQRDAKKAEKLMTTHLVAVEQTLINHLPKAKFKSENK